MENSGRHCPNGLKKEIISYTETIQDVQGKEVKVLYQKLGTRWYAISLVEDDIYYGTVPDEAVGTS